MKTLKFWPIPAEKILDGSKTTTWRFFDDKDLQIGDQISCVYTFGGEEFAQIKLTKVVTKKLKNLTEEDWQGHEKFKSDEEMYQTYSQYYNQPVTEETELKVIDFKVIDINPKIL